MRLICFDENGFIKGIMSDSNGIQPLSSDAILIDEPNYRKLNMWYRATNLKYLFNVEGGVIEGEDVDLTLYFEEYKETFEPPFEPDSAKIERLEKENTQLKTEVDELSLYTVETMIDNDFRLSMIEINMMTLGL